MTIMNAKNQSSEVNETEVEVIKRSSDFLRGDLAEQLDTDAPNISGEGEQLLKFHGIYAQDNRDVRRERSLAKEPLDYNFMIRVAIPGGRLSTAQWLALDHLSGEIADGSIRLTTRQAVQFHGVRKQGLRPLARVLDEHLMTSFGACGDVVRNIVTCPALQTEDLHGPLQVMTQHLASTFKPTTRAHWEIFVNGEQVDAYEPVPEHSFYGKTYLPRKFKIAIAHPGDNCVDVFAQDVGLVPGVHPEAGAGFSVFVGGGLGKNYANKNTFARLADPLAFATYDEVDNLIRAVIDAYRILGDRTDRKRARLKYVVADGGISSFRDEVAKRFGQALRDPLPVMPEINTDDHLGWRELPDGTWQLGIRVGAGRVRDTQGGPQFRSALRFVAEHYPVEFLITPQQDLLVARVPGGNKEEITKLLADHGICPVEELGAVERTALACPALPTCGQALAESERVLPTLVDSLEEALTERGIGRRPLQLRMTGCPNGCARPNLAEVGVVGRTKSTYDIYLGGGTRGDRLAQLHQEKVKFEDIPGVIAPWLDRWRDEGTEDESFGDFYTRVAGS